MNGLKLVAAALALIVVGGHGFFVNRNGVVTMEPTTRKGKAQDVDKAEGAEGAEGSTKNLDLALSVEDGDLVVPEGCKV